MEKKHILNDVDGCEAVVVVAAPCLAVWVDGASLHPWEMNGGSSHSQVRPHPALPCASKRLWRTLWFEALPCLIKAGSGPTRPSVAFVLPLKRGLGGIIARWMKPCQKSPLGEREDEICQFGSDDGVSLSMFLFGYIF